VRPPIKSGVSHTIQSANAGRVISGVTVRRPRPASGVRWLLSSCPARPASGLLAPPARLSAFERRYPGRYRHGQNLLANFALKHGRRKPTLGAPDYESGGREFESLWARQHLAPTFRCKKCRYFTEFARNRHIPLCAWRNIRVPKHEPTEASLIPSVLDQPFVT